MPTLTITTETITEVDFGGLNETLKRYTAKIDGKECRLVRTAASTADDVTEKTAMKTDLTALGYTWTAEA